MSVRFCAFGSLGSGKTLTLVKEAYRYALKHPDNNVWANIKLNSDIFKNFKPIQSARDLFHIDKNCFVGLDEDWHIADSRSSQSPENKAQGFILLRSRKKNWVVGFTEQWFTQMDIRLRFVTDVWILPQFYVQSGILQEDCYDLHANFLGTRFYDGTKFFELYDSYADPFTLNMQEVEREYDYKRYRKGL